MNIAEKSMEKTRFYNREDLKAKDVARLISIWEGEAGESFTDYCNFSREADKNFLLFLAEKYPILYDYHCKVAGNDWLDHCIQYVVDHCGEYLTQWVPAEEYHLSWQLEEMAIYPLADFILKDDGNPTREIYDNLNDTLVWDNSSIVNRGDIITQNLRGISDQLFRIMESEPEEFNAGCVSFASVKEVLEKLGWTDISSIDTNGWDIDYWVTFIKEGKDFNYIVSGNLYYGNINIKKEKF